MEKSMNSPLELITATTVSALSSIGLWKLDVNWATVTAVLVGASAVFYNVIRGVIKYKEYKDKKDEKDLDKN